MDTMLSRFSKHPVLRWLPAVLVMLAIFLFSATPSREMPFNLLRYVTYKSGHVLGYALLALSLWRALAFNSKRLWLAWLLAMLYALSDEYHQSFIAGRHPALFDVFVYDNLGALLSVWLAAFISKQKQPTEEGLVAQSLTNS